MNSKLRKINVALLVAGISALIFYFIGMIFGLAKLIIPFVIIFVCIGLAFSIPFAILLIIKNKGDQAIKIKKELAKEKETKSIDSNGYFDKVKKENAKYQDPEDEVVDYVNGEKDFDELSVDAQIEYFEEWDE